MRERGREREREIEREILTRNRALMLTLSIGKPITFSF